jgi:hypothetical protein
MEDAVVEGAAPAIEGGMDEIAEMVHHCGKGAHPAELIGEDTRGPGMAGAVRGGEDEDPARRSAHATGRLATSRVSFPACTVSPRWLTTFRSSITTPPSRMLRLVRVRDTL